MKTPVLHVSSMQQLPQLSFYEQPKKPEMIAETTESERNNAKSTAVLLTPNEASLYQTAVAQISSAEPNQRYPKKEVTARLLFDTGSSHSFITEKAANKLFLKRQQGDPLTISSFGSDSTQQVSNSCATFNVELSGGGIKSITANVVPKITSPIAREPLNFDTYPELKMVSLADHIHSKRGDLLIDILIGNDYYYDFIKASRMEISPSLTLLSSSLGMIPAGRYTQVDKSSQSEYSKRPQATQSENNSSQSGPILLLKMDESKRCDQEMEKKEAALPSLAKDASYESEIEDAEPQSPSLAQDASYEANTTKTKKKRRRKARKPRRTRP
ncbi:MAG: hypothetical protein GY820_14180, partial [Gammaproteobacteria bacterium]|nr:hypothetical protein [Gammaproteobacteria bacterium]